MDGMPPFLTMGTVRVMVKFIQPSVLQMSWLSYPEPARSSTVRVVGLALEDSVS